MIQIDNLGMRYGKRILFDGASMNLNEGCRYGITGANGSGKSTLLGIMSGEITPEDGAVRVPLAVKVGFLKQDHFEHEEERIVDVVLMGRPRLWSALIEKEELLAKGDFDEAAGMKLAELESDIAGENGYEAESEAAVILEGLGIDAPFDLMKSLSGGYKLRVLLAQCLFGRPGLLLLDEPTNHLDIVSIAWLEGYLRDYPGTVAVVSHDHHFLNAVVTHILDVDYEMLRLYPGNYDGSLEAKALERTQKEQEISRQEKKKEELSAFYNRFRAQATKARQAMSRKKQLDKMEDIVIKRSSRIAPKFRFLQKRPSGKQVLDIKGLSKSFGDNQVIKDLTLDIMRGERVAIIGPNGAGKTTLIKMIFGELEPDTGTIKHGHEVHTGYFAQNHKEQVLPGSTPYEWLLNRSSNETDSAVRSTLGKMLFSGDDAKKKTEALSGGEAARLVFSRLMLASDNMLLLDEPTNHLDIESVEALADSLTAYPGTVVFVSHDRFFVEHVATSILEVTKNGCDYYKGTYAEFLSLKEEDHLDRQVENSRKKSKKKPTAEKPQIDVRALSKELSKLEAKADKMEDLIKTLETRKDNINEELATGDLYRKGGEEDLKQRLAKLKKTESELEKRLASWEAAHETIAELKEKLSA